MIMIIFNKNSAISATGGRENLSLKARKRRTLGPEVRLVLHKPESDLK